jgi:hypothetical protein
MDYSVVNRVDYQLVQGDTGSKLRVTCKDNDTDLPIVLTGATIILLWKNVAGTLATKTMTIVDAVNGIVEYQFSGTEIEPQKMSFEIKIVDSTGKIVRSLQLIDLPVRAALI